MAEPFSVTLDVIQLTGVAFKLSSIIYSKVKTFRNYSREVKRVLKGFELHRQIFLHEIRLFLRQAQQNDEDIDQMLDDTDHPNWKSKDLQLGLEHAFGISLDACQSIIEDIGLILKTLRDELSCFDEIEGMCPTVSRRTSWWIYTNLWECFCCNS